MRAPLVARRPRRRAPRSAQPVQPRPDARSTPQLVAAAAVESVAENASDSFVAPLFYYALLGLPGALVYRAVNTLDAMIGYRGRYEYLGKAAARLDDLLNLVPARLTARAAARRGALRGRGRAARRARAARATRGRTASPNAGHPMAAMAGLLGVRSRSPAPTALGDARQPVDAGDDRRRVALDHDRRGRDGRCSRSWRGAARCLAL